MTAGGARAILARMKTPAAVALVAVTLASLPACARHQGLFKPPHDKGKQEIVVLHVNERSGSCKLYDRTPPEIRTQLGSDITWIVAGSCPGDRISIDPMFRRANGTPVRIVRSTDLNGDIAAESGQRLTAQVQTTLPKELQKGLYFYQVNINGVPAEYNSRADDGEFYMCPKWPCGGFE